MPRMENNGGDVLARGAASATFRPAGEKLSREQWGEIFDGESQPVVKAVYKFTCPTHGVFTSERECYVSGGFPQLDEYVSGLCTVPNCEHGTKPYSGPNPCPYAGYEVIASEETSGNTDSGEATGNAGADSGEACQCGGQCDLESGTVTD